MIAPTSVSNVLPWPGSFLLRRLDERTAIYRFSSQPFVYHHAYKGVGTFEAFCPEQGLRNWHQDALPTRMVTVARAAAGAGCQLIVWLHAGVAAGLATNMIAAWKGSDAADIYMAEHYVPLMVSLIVATVAAYVGSLVGGCLLLRQCLR